MGVYRDGWSQPDVTRWSVDPCSEVSRSVVEVSFWSVLTPPPQKKENPYLDIWMAPDGSNNTNASFCHFRVGRFAADKKAKESKISRQPFFFFFIVIRALPCFQTAPCGEIFRGMKRLRRDT